MIDDVNFVMKFHVGPHALPISADERIQKVAYYKDNILHIHCETTDAEPYSFMVVVNNTMSPFSVVPFLQSLQGSPYETLIKEVESEIDRQVWTTKEDLPLRAQSIASKVRNIIHSMAKMAAVRKAVMSALMPIDLNRAIGTQNTSEASARDTISQGGPQSAADPSSTRRNKKRPSRAIESTLAESQVRRPTVQPQAKGSTASALTEVPMELDNGDEEDLRQSQRYITSSRWNAMVAISLRWTRIASYPLISLTSHQLTGRFAPMRKEAWRRCGTKRQPNGKADTVRNATIR